VFYIGHSQGSAQLFYGFSHNPEYFRSHLYKALHLAPCFIPDYDKSDIYHDKMMAMSPWAFDHGIKAYAGPHWEQDREVMFNEWYHMTDIVLMYDTKEPVST
jgi:hypothetical protein